MTNTLHIKNELKQLTRLYAFLDQQAGTYELGELQSMQINVNVEPEILIVDEALSVGDKTFQSKCITKIREIMAGGKVTFLFVTHSTAAAKEFCRRGIVLDKGKIILDGEIEESIGFYERQK